MALTKRLGEDRRLKAGNLGERMTVSVLEAARVCGRRQTKRVEDEFPLRSGGAVLDAFGRSVAPVR